MAASKSVILCDGTSGYLELLACLVEQFGGGINFLCSDLTQCQERSGCRFGDGIRCAESPVSGPLFHDQSSFVAVRCAIAPARKLHPVTLQYGQWHPPDEDETHHSISRAAMTDGTVKREVLTASPESADSTNESSRQDKVLLRKIKSILQQTLLLTG